jgi:hypothetical protein
VNVTNPISASDVSTTDTQVHYRSFLLQLACSAVPAGGAPTLDVYLQTSVDNGTTWQDIAHTQFTGAATRFFQISGQVTGSTAPVAASDGALSGETVRQGPFGTSLRIKYTAALGGGTGTWTLTPTISPHT